MGDLENLEFLARALVMSLLTVARMPYIAADLLVIGHDTPTLRLCAGMGPDDDPILIKRYFGEALGELGFPPPSEAETRWIQAVQWAKDILADRITPYRGAWLIWKFTFWQIEDPTRREQLSAFVGLEDDWQVYPRQRARIERDIVDAAKRVVAFGTRS